MPVILDSKGDFESGQESDEESIRPIAPHRQQKAQTAPAESDPMEPVEPVDEELRTLQNEVPSMPSSPPGSSHSLEDLSPDVHYASGRQTTDDVNPEKRVDSGDIVGCAGKGINDINDNADTRDPVSPAHIGTAQKSGRAFFGFKMPSPPVSWVWNKKTGRVAPDEFRQFSQAVSVLPAKTLE